MMTRNMFDFLFVFSLFDCSNQMSITSIRNKCSVEYASIKKAENDKRRVLGPCVTYIHYIYMSWPYNMDIPIYKYTLYSL